MGTAYKVDHKSNKMAVFWDIDFVNKPALHPALYYTYTFIFYKLRSADDAESFDIYPSGLFYLDLEFQIELM